MGEGVKFLYSIFQDTATPKLISIIGEEKQEDTDKRRRGEEVEQESAKVGKVDWNRLSM